MMRWVSLGWQRRWLLGGVLVSALAAAWLLWINMAKDVQPSHAGGAVSPDHGVTILLELAAGAGVRQQLVAPAGANLFEFSLSALQLEPNNPIALSGLRDAFTAACEDVERAINADQLDEAQRELALLQEYDPTNYTLLLLGGKLDAQRALSVRADEARAAILQARQAAAQR
jgi:protein TonB